MRWLVLIVLGLSGRIFADGGLVRIDEAIPSGRLVALTAPTPVIAGVLDLTVLAPDGVEVEFVLGAWDDWAPSEAWKPLAGSRREHPEGVGAILNVEAGAWRVWLRAGDHLTSFRLDVTEASQFSDAWPWLLPLAGVAVVVLLRRGRKQASRA